MLPLLQMAVEKVALFGCKVQTKQKVMACEVVLTDTAAKFLPYSLKSPAIGSCNLLRCNETSY